MQTHKIFYTVCGIVSLVLWSTSTYCFKKTIDAFGIFSGFGIVQLLSGFLGIILYVAINGNTFTKITKESSIVIFLLLINLISNGLIYALPPPGEVLFQCSIIGYMWTILLNILLVVGLDYKIKYKAGFYLGLLFAFVGITISCVGFDFEKINFPKYFLKYYYCYISAVIAAFSWAYYSVYSIKFKQFVNNDHTFISFCMAGILLLLFSFANPKLNKFNEFNKINSDYEILKSIGFLLYSVVMATIIPYYLWNIGYTKGNSKIIANFSLLSPVTNVTITQVIYGIPLLKNIITGAIVLVIAMAFCKYSIEKNNIVSNDIANAVTETDNSLESTNFIDLIYSTDSTNSIESV